MTKMQIATKDGSVLVCGVLAKDVELKEVGDKGAKLCKFSLKVGEKSNPDGSDKPVPVWCGCIAWRNIANGCSQFKKGDSILAVGQITTREYQGKEVRELVIAFAIAMPCGAEPQIKPPQDFQEQQFDDKDLPF